MVSLKTLNWTELQINVLECIDIEQVITQENNNGTKSETSLKGICKIVLKYKIESNQTNLIFYRENNNFSEQVLYLKFISFSLF